MRFLALVALLSLIGAFPRDARSQLDESLPTGGILQGIGNVASSATNFLSTAVEKPRKLLINATRVTTGYIDSAAAKGLEFKLRRVLEKFRSRMQYGIPEFGIPVLEPFQLDELRIQVDNEEIGNVNLIIEDLLVRNLSTFVIDRAKLSLLGPTITGNLTIPRVTAQGYYNISGTLGDTLPLSGAGPFQAVLYDLRLYANAVLGFSRGLYLKSFDLDFALGSMNMHLENFMSAGGRSGPNGPSGPSSDGDGDNADDDADDDPDDEDAIGTVMSQVFQELTPQALEVLKPDVLPAIQESIAEHLNDTIRHLTMRDVFHVLIGHNEFRNYDTRFFPTGLNR